ncbi:MAG: hypothetical protein ACTSSA_03165 [Candidatus Freyarchaeota archaeon]
MTKKIILKRLRELLSSMENEDPENLEAKLDGCWVEFWEKEHDQSISREIINENKRILEEISIAIEVYQAGVINTERLKRIKTNILKNEQ